VKLFIYSYSLHASVRGTILRGNIYRHITNYCKDNVHQDLVYALFTFLRKWVKIKKWHP